MRKPDNVIDAGYNEDEIVGKPIGMVASEKGSKEICVKSDAIKKFIKKEHVDNVYNTYYSKDGNPIPVLFSRSLMYDKDKLISGMIFIGHHITENNGEIKAMQENEEKNYRNIKTLGEIPLTKRELEIIKLIAEEFSNLEIAENLYGIRKLFLGIVLRALFALTGRDQASTQIQKLCDRYLA